LQALEELRQFRQIHARRPVGIAGVLFFVRRLQKCETHAVCAGSNDG
jgi:hypothetical protein